MSEDSSKKPAPHYPWGIPAGVIMTLVAVVITQPVAAILISLYPAIAGWDSSRADEWLFNSPIANFAAILIFEILSLAVIAAFIARKRIAFRVAAALGVIRWRDLAYTLLGFLAYFGMAIVALAVVPLFLPIDIEQEQAIGFEPGSGSTALVLAFIGLVILPPIVEEIIFRGFLYGIFRANKISAVWSMIVTSLLFGSLHLMGGADGNLLWVGFVDTFLLSIVLCYAREKTGTIWASIGIHALKNGFVFVNLFLLSAN